ncbi:MAG: M15 family metallopeptidase, partial [Ruthenibacterium sp.]
PILFDFDKADAEPIIPQQAEKRTIAPDTTCDDDDFAEASTEAASMPEMSLFDDEAPMAQPEAFAAPAQPMVFDESAAPNYGTEETPKQHYRPVFAGPVPNPIAEAKAARAAARAAAAAAALQALQAPAQAPTPAQPAAPAVMAQDAAVASPAIPEAPAVPVLETPVGTPITAPVTPAQPEMGSFENSFSNLPVFEMPVPETTVSEPAPIEKIPFASNLAALLNGEPETAPPTPLAPEKDFGQDLFADENFFDGGNPFENEFEAIPAVPAEQAYAPEDDATKVFQPLTETDTVASYEDFAPKEPTPAPAFNPFESNEWKDEIDDDDDTGVIETPVRRTEKRQEDANVGTSARARTSSGSKGKKPKKANQLPLILLLGVLVLAIVGIAVYAISGGLGKKKAPSSVASLPPISTSVSTAPSSSSAPLPVAPVVAPIPRDEWYMKLANKQSPLPAEFTVKTGKTADGIDVDERIRGAVNDMIAGAKEQGIKLKTVAGYRSYERQEKSYNSRVAEFVKAGKSKEEAQTAAAVITAPPGASEHNLGLSVDMQSVASHDYADTFKDSAEAKWLLDNAANYGFILRYPQGKEAVTGFEFEPWHYRYVGVDEAQKIKASGLTLEEYLAQDAPTGIPEATPAA